MDTLKLGLKVPEHRAIAYAVLGCVHPQEVEILTGLRFEKSTYQDYPTVQLHGRGAAARLINAGQFDLDALISQ